MTIINSLDLIPNTQINPESTTSKSRKMILLIVTIFPKKNPWNIGNESQSPPTLKNTLSKETNDIYIKLVELNA